MSAALLALGACDGGTPAGDGGAGAMDSGSMGTDGGGCPAGETMCGGSCVDTSGSTQHCGGCDQACAATEVCSAGTCRAPMMCEGGLVDCGAGCTDTGFDDDHCGSCGAACPFGQGCNDGTCEDVCGGSETACDFDGVLTCVDTSTDPSSCGACGNACALGEACVGGTCGCPGGTTMCGASCVDTATNPLFCGDCDTACPTGALCDSGACTCAGGLDLCDDTCVNTDVDNAHCGGCGNPCATPGETCVAGACVSACGVGTVLCGGTCTNLSVDDAHCGSCGNACGTGTSCDVGRCRPDNDLFADATTLSWPSGGGELSVTGTTVNAARDGLVADCEANGPNVWYRFTLTERQPVWVDTAGSSYDTAVFLTDATGMPLRGWCNDDCGCGSTGDFSRPTESCSWGVLDAGTYYVSVGGYVAGSSGAFTLHVQRLPRVGRLFESRMVGDDYTGRERLEGTSSTDGTCYSPAMSSGEDQYWFVSCGDAREQTFSVCPADDSAFFFDPHWDIEYDGRVFDPVMYSRAATDGAEVACNDDNVGVDCYDTSDRMNLGARLADVGAERGLNTVILDSRTGGSGMRYRMRFVVPEIDVSTRR
ncbi:MAG: pre-peptidase C-terminal domain-containing protein [Sandaracinaceae bacterium]